MADDCEIFNVVQSGASSHTNVLALVGIVDQEGLSACKCSLISV